MLVSSSTIMAVISGLEKPIALFTEHRPPHRTGYNRFLLSASVV